MPGSDLLPIIERYTATRDLADKSFYSVCYAPFVSLYFDQVGNVRVCCQNTTYLVGNVTTMSLDEIWRGERIHSLREALVGNDFQKGCRFCEWQLSDGNFTGSFMRTFDRFPLETSQPDYPAQMEFSVSNTCNLECVMCNGEWSSSIRSRREKLPPLPKAYSESFFEQLAAYLPHLKRAKFLGGEPFLAAESLRVWNMMVDMGLSIPCHVTTNGTQYNARVERILEHLPVSIGISMDGVTKETVERVRVNARYEELMANFRRFHAYARRRGTEIGLTYCLMRQNWHEFGDYLLFADEWDCDVYVNTVIQPFECSLHTLRREELAEIVGKLLERDPDYQSRLRRNRQVWIDEVERLRNRAEHKFERKVYFEPGFASHFQRERSEGGGGEARGPALDEPEARAMLAAWSPSGKYDELWCDLDDVATAIASEEGSFLGLSGEEVVGKALAQLGPILGRRYGSDVSTLEETEAPGYLDRLVAFRTKEATTFVRAITLPRRDEHGGLVGTKTLAARTTQEPVVVAISQGP